MLHWILIFLGIALVAGLFGFRRISSTAFGIAEVLIIVVIVMIVLAVVAVLSTGMI